MNVFICSTHLNIVLSVGRQDGGSVFGGEVVGGFNKTLPAKPFLTGPNKSEKNLEYLQNGKFSR